MPDFANLDFPEIKGGDKVLNPEKYESADFDITNATGVSPVLTNGTKGNYASAKLNLDIIYKKIGAMLEILEEMYNQLIAIVLGESKAENYFFEYNKETPLEKQKRLDTLLKLQAQGYSTAAVLEELNMDADKYFEESIYEIEVLKLREKIYPSQSVYTTSGSDVGGRPSVDPTNTSTQQTQEIDANNNPKANV